MSGGFPGHAGLIVVDDFYQDWRIVRNQALSCNYRNVPGATLSYLHAEPNQELSANSVTKVLQLIGQEFAADFLESHFFLGTEQAAKKNLARNAWIHFDRCRWVGIVYLNEWHQCRGGTAFYRHRATGVQRWEQLFRLGPNTVSRVMSDSAKLDAWQQVAMVGMVPNRLVLFDSRQFHQALEYFGASPEDGRLTQHFYFREVPDGQMNMDWEL